MYLLELFRSEFQVFFFEVEVALIGNGHEMDMGVGNFKSDDGHGDAFAWHGFFDGGSDFFGEDHHLSEFFVFDIEDIVGLMFRHDEGMAFGERIDVEEGEETLVLGDFIARDLTLYDS